VINFNLKVAKLVLHTDFRRRIVRVAFIGFWVCLGGLVLGGCRCACMGNDSPPPVLSGVQVEVKDSV
jgi:hypothetical protein